MKLTKTKLKEIIREELLKEKDHQTVAVYNFKGHTYFASNKGISSKFIKSFFAWPVIEFLYKIGKRGKFIK